VIAERDGIRDLPIEIRLPRWVARELERAEAFDSVEQRMDLVISLAESNARRGSGGPFAAAVFDLENRALLAVGVNLVVASGYSIAHAEMVALSLAQRATGGFDLGSGTASRELVSSVEPCAMCLGAICWSGVRQIVCAARGEDAAEIGFDEGPKTADWVGELERRGIAVRRDIMRERAAAVLRLYRDSGGPIYNARAGTRAR
jgi:tRNA(Arg) A34 adenosine deaminase TadA